MKLQFVEISGFRGFRDKTRLEIPSGFSVLSGHNGTGKSTVLDAIEFAITGTISKYAVKEARGGGLDEHIWWVGNGEASEHYVSVGFINGQSEIFVVTRSRARGSDVAEAEILSRLSRQIRSAQPSLQTLMQTTLIRDELIAALSLDLPEQARFAAVRTAIGGLVGPDYSERTGAILNAANTAKNRQADRLKESQNELGRALSSLTEARSMAERSSDISEALQIIESSEKAFEGSLSQRTDALRRYVAERKLALQEIEEARSRADSLMAAFDFANSPEGQSRIKDAQSGVENAMAQRSQASEASKLAKQFEETEKTADAYASHLAALIEHGTALGLQDGHCPLCDAARSDQEFETALAAAKNQLDKRGSRLEEASLAVARAEAALTAAEEALTIAQKRRQEVEYDSEAEDVAFTQIEEVYNRHQFSAPPRDPKLAQRMLFTEQQNLVRLERALGILENSNAVERVKSLEQRIAQLRELGDQETAKLTEVEKSVESARQIDVAAKTVRNEILTEQFDTVMPLLKELYRRLRPHADWTEIESDFGGKVRASLNFTVGEGYNPQFLFSSGQRRATGLAFLLAVHLSRPWCTWTSLLLDDPVQHIDDYRSLNLVEVLSAIRRTGRQIIIAVEDAALADLLCRRLRSTTSQPGRHFELRTSNDGTAEIASTYDVNPMPHLVLRPALAS